MRVVFMGTPPFAAAVLEELSRAYDVVGVYTRPDAVRGRGKARTASPVKVLAERLGLPVSTPRTLRDPQEGEALSALAPDVICVAAYGCLLPRDVLDIPPLGCVNVHASLLPRWRGAAPIERAILAGDDETGICIMRMTAELDAGPFCVRRSVPVDDRTAAELSEELAGIGARALVTALADMEAGTAHWIEQDEAGVTYADRIAKGELDLDPHLEARDNVRRVRASSAAHPARCVIADRSVTVTAVREACGEAQSEKKDPGNAAFSGRRLVLSCADDGAFEVLSLKPDGKRDMDAASFAAGMPVLRASSGSTWRSSHEQ